ncbi:hypothetical protein CH267_19390 [Rhodococcus sp. 06-621-2]|nr:BTAD domain-containing putative transcriptional regulator [Rhodococcus sp. 06-621-2]OZC52154.1 hypothetical protein CH267_19390 [Rhodococcus sp. 06-621-2]
MSLVPTHTLTIGVLGPMHARLDDRDIDLAGPGRRAVLARFVLARGSVVSTDLLIEDLWSGEPPPKALAALQVHVSNLRRTLEPDRRPRTPATVLVSSAPGYRLVLPTEQVDVWHFESLVVGGIRESDPTSRLGRFDRALASWSGSPYQGLADTHWAAVEIARLDELRSTAVEERAHTLLDLGAAPTVVIADLGRHVADSPGRERPVHILALAQYRAGRQADALDTLSRARRYLSDELGIDPGPELRTLERAILAQDPALDAPHVVDAATARVSFPAPAPKAPVVNCRPEETQVVLDAARGVEHGSFDIVWLGGEPGQGKSTLADTVAHHLAARGWTAAWGSCPEVDGTPPGWPWSEVLASLRSQAPVPGELRQILDPASASDGVAVETFWLARALIGYLTRLSATAPLVLVFDDCHRADELTMQLLRHLILAPRGARVLIVATYRTSEVSAELDTVWAATAGTPSTKMRLTGLTPGGVAEVAKQSGYTDMDADVLDVLAERTDGNPLFVREFARLIVSEGAAAARSSIPVEIGEVLRRRITRLPENSVLTLRRASVLGRDVDLSVLSAMSDRTEDELIDALEPAVLAGLLTETDSGRLRFTHALVRDTLYTELPLMRRTRFHGNALQVLAARTPHDPALLAHHAALSATPTTALTLVPFVVDAARRAAAFGSHREALVLWSSAVELHESAVDGSETDLLDILIPYVGSLARAGDTASARRRRRRAVDIASAPGTTTHLGRRRSIDALTSWSAPVVWSIRPDVVVDASIVDPVRALLLDADIGVADRALLLSTLVFEIEGNDVAETVAAASDAVRHARLSQNDAVLCRALNAYGYATLGPDLARTLFATSEELLCAAVADPAYQSLGHYYAFLSHCAATELDEADASAAAVIIHASGQQLGEMLGVVRIYRAACDIASGRTDSALRGYSEAAAQMVAGGSAIAHLITMIGRLGVATYLGDLAPMVDELSAIENMRPQSVRYPLIVALLDSGEKHRARELWLDAEPYDRDYYWLGMTAHAARAAARLGDLEAATKLPDELSPFSGRIAGFDSGAFYAGTVDSALAATAEALGDTAAAEELRARSDALLESLRHRVATSSGSYVIG